ncbi:hypothetical protein LTR91_019001 [Friedmanniomyces endolithicus]|uniref:Uncharacterized protein n=1 Tax=Friedmanniomyces endolithicus TaxID=329885 RepID=A0AAN6HBI9_9PEZI|nr:hypothetical protein LTR94_013200 [Friedmanniomyces endolithicus]KAK0783751.1 hypothetical protein LTR59_011637 [Friedmanniomyces endolithicus]KAK0803289.1 hypothetical protein LTR75_008045 [Friedmanniomyces endolithicus]KAK0894995.1 hypothetical protein LTR02_012022 [Friedmanniomyces endolithicus]KAK0909845.1 hypothetical protein LTR57_016211 [Friedmanniomyces endolithicus]
MADDEDFEVDPALAEAMGFSGFGVQPGKKRKYDANDTFVDPDLAKDSNGAFTKPAGKGANSLPLGLRKKESAASGLPMKPAMNEASGAGIVNETPAGPLERSLGPGQSDLQALRAGVKNERGDMVYFKPSFLEDPWKDLKPT